MDSDALADRLRHRWTRYYHEVERPRECISCGGKRIWKNGTRYRSGTGVVEGHTVTVDRFPCRRVRCRSCRVSWTLLPPDLVPGRHFAFQVGANALSDYLFSKEKKSLEVAARASFLSARTLGRVRNFFAGLVRPSFLSRLILERTGEPILPTILEVVAVKRRAKRHRQRVFLTRAAQILCLFEALSRAVGLTAASLLSRILGHRRTRVLCGRHGIPAEAWRQAAGLPVNMSM